MKLIRRVGATSQIFQIFIADSSSTTGAGLTGLTNASSGLTAYYHRDTDTTATAISLVTMTVGTFTSSGFKEIDATNMPGWYQFCPPNAALASGAASVGFHLKGATNMAPLPIEVDLDSQVDVYLWNGTAVSSPATAGIPDVNIKNMNNVAATSITTINANQGTTQPLNFTGTGASAYVQGDLQNWIGVAPLALRDQWVQSLPMLAAATAQAGSSNTITLAAGSSAIDNYYTGLAVVITSSTGALQTRLITGYVGATKVATVDSNWITNPTSSSHYALIPASAVSSVVNTVTSNVTQWNGSNVSAATAGIPDVNIKNMNNIAATSITTINANQGTTQPINFTGTGGTALAKSDMVDIAGSAVSASTAQLGVNVVNIKGTASAGTAGYVGLDWGTINAPTTTQSLTGTTISTSQVVASVTGAVGSVTGNVGGNVTGSVGSVVAAVAITSNRKKGSSITVEFTMQDSTTGADKTGLTVASVVSKDGGTFASTTNSVTEIANGWYQLVLTATEATANNISLQMTATGAINRDIFIQTQP